MNYKCWIGENNKFIEEVNKLLSLLNNSNNLILSASKNSGFDWIVNCQENYDDTFPKSTGNIALQTSGTTGSPKTIWKSLNEIYNTKKGNGSSEDIWLLTYNPARWAGISVIIHCLKNNSKIAVPESLTVGKILKIIDSVTHISLTPSLFRNMILYDSNKLRQSNIKQLTFGGEYATQKILDKAKEIFPNAKISHIYATTEYGDICSCSDGLEGFPLSKMPNLYNGDSWKVENNRAYFTGRISEIINIGGAKITQTEIEKITETINGVFQCRAFPISNALLGQVVGLEYVGNISPKEIKLSLLKLLPKYAVPIKIIQVKNILLNNAYKVKR